MQKSFTRSLLWAYIAIAGVISSNAASLSLPSSGQNVSGGRDNSYEIISDTTGEISAPAQAFVVTTLGNGWAPPIGGTSWIGPSANQALANQPSGDPGNSSDTYRMAFSLAGFDASTAALNITMMSDNGVTVLLNGSNVYQNGDGLAVLFTAPFSFSIHSGFVSGLNTLDFVVANAFGPTGIDVSMSGSATATPEPGLAGLVAILTLLLIWRQRFVRRGRTLW